MNLLIIVKHFNLYPWIVAKSYTVEFKALLSQCSILLQLTNKQLFSFNSTQRDIFLILPKFLY